MTEATTQTVGTLTQTVITLDTLLIQDKTDKDVLMLPHPHLLFMFYITCYIKLQHLKQLHCPLQVRVIG